MKLQSATIGWWNQEFMMIALIWLTGFSKGFELQTSWGDLCKKCNLKNVGGRVYENEVRSQEPFSLHQSFLYPKSDNVSETFWLLKKCNLGQKQRFYASLKSNSNVLVFRIKFIWKIIRASVILHNYLPGSNIDEARSHILT